MRVARDDDALRLRLVVVDVRGAGYTIDSSRRKAQPQDAGDLKLLLGDEEMLERKTDVSQSFKNFVAVVLVALLGSDLVADVGEIKTQLRPVGEPVPKKEIGPEDKEVCVAVLRSRWPGIRNRKALPDPAGIRDDFRQSMVLNVDIQTKLPLLDRLVVL